MTRTAVPDLARSATLALVVAGADLATKWLAERRLDEPISLAAGVRLELGHNSGIAFGLLNDLPSGVLVAGIGILVAALLAAMRCGLLPLSWPAAGLLLGGAVANLLDRLSDGRVTDFIELPRWPAFNVADIAITCAVLLALWHSARHDRAASRAAAIAEDAPARQS